MTELDLISLEHGLGLDDDRRSETSVALDKPEYVTCKFLLFTILSLP